jgi:hypothetical protein
MVDQALALLDQVSAPYDEGVLNIIWHTYSIIQRYTPHLVPAMRAARQQQGVAGDIGSAGATASDPSWGTGKIRLNFPLARISSETRVNVQCCR